MKVESLKFFRMLLLLLLMTVAIFIYKGRLASIAIIIMAVIVFFVLVLSFMIKIVKYKKYKYSIELKFAKFYSTVALKHPKIKLLNSKFKNKLFIAYKKRFSIKIFFKIAELILYVIITVTILVLVFLKFINL